MDKNRDKQEEKSSQTSTGNQPSPEQQPVHFERANETYGNEETLEDEAAAEQQRKEALTERD